MAKGLLPAVDQVRGSMEVIVGVEVHHRVVGFADVHVVLHRSGLDMRGLRGLRRLFLGLCWQAILFIIS